MSRLINVISALFLSKVIANLERTALQTSTMRYKHGPQVVGFYSFIRIGPGKH